MDTAKRYRPRLREERHLCGARWEAGRALRVLCLALAIVFLFLPATLGSAERPASGQTGAGRVHAPGPGDVFPYTVFVDTLANGLTLTVCPFPSPGAMAYFTLVRAGSRNEVEPGRTGYAHLFEHMMFRGSRNYPGRTRGDLLEALGSDDNGYTSDDVTVYIVVTRSDALDEVVRAEADRVMNLDYDRLTYQIETGAVLGEYNKEFADPGAKLEEVLRAAAYTRHTYRHTAMGFLEDIQAMPDGYDYSRSFFGRYYVPANTQLFVAGDVDPARVRESVEREYRGWKGAYAPPKVRPEPAQKEERRVHVDWDTPAPPRLTMAFHTPAWTEGLADAAALRILAQIYFGPASPLYRRLVLEKQLLHALRVEYEERRDPGLLVVSAILKKKEDLPRVEAALAETFTECRSAPPAEKRLADARDNLRFGYLMSLEEVERVAGSLSWYAGLTGDPLYVNRVYRALQAVTPADVQRVARSFLVESNRTVATLWPKETPSLGGIEGRGLGAPGAPAAGAGVAPGAKAEAAAGAGGEVQIVELPVAADPIVDLRLLFRTGSVDDPPGLEGLTALTAQLMAEGGTESLSAAELRERLWPMAGQIDVQVEKEVTVFQGRIHRDRLSEFLPLFLDCLLKPRLVTEDFERLRDRAKNDIARRLRHNDNEDLGQRALEGLLFAGHPYGHLIQGTMAGLDAASIGDVRRHFRSKFTRDRLMAGLGGGYAPSLPRELREALGALPASSAPRSQIPPPPQADPVRLLIVEEPGRSTAISLGYPWEIDRRHPDYPALCLAISYWGEHRQMSGVLFRRMRAQRGLNYGDYAYVEHFAQDGWSRFARPNIPRAHQYFSIWVRPVESVNGLFALREAFYELDRLSREGVDPQKFARARDFVIGYSRLKEESVSRRLGLLLDDAYLGLPDFAEALRRRLESLTLEEVNAAVRRHLRPELLRAVVVTQDGAALRRDILEKRPSPITYAAQPPADVLAEDRTIESFDLGLTADEITVIKADSLFAD